MARIIDGNTDNMVGNQVKYYRKLRKYTQQILSDKLETMAIYICRGSISRIEDGSRTVTDIELYGLSQILDVSIEELFAPVNNTKNNII
ncbi:MAG: helix-turn-helix transcriptional regulator [Lachnospiraceae bacterium]|nr:helix-turn-helix transcriptional regulator [Lachnospiraceae bacterium]